MPQVLFTNRPSGSVVLSINGSDHRTTFGEDESFSRLLKEAICRGLDPADALRYLAVIGVHVWHSGRNPPDDLLAGCGKFFGSPIGSPNGSLLGSIIVGVNGRKFVAPVAGGDYYDSHILRAHERGENAAQALLFLAEVGTRLNQANYSMLGGQQREELNRRFGL